MILDNNCNNWNSVLTCFSGSYVCCKIFCIKYIERVQGTEKLWKCKCGKELKQRKGTGWSYLHTHIKVQHGLQEDGDDKNQKTITHPSFGLINNQALNIYSWLDWICNDLKPFSFVESENTRKYTNLEKISRNTFMKYLNLVTEKNISKQLPCKFALIFDGWSHMSTHYVAIFASFNGPDEKCKTALLTFSPLLDESHLNAAGHVQLIEAALALYGKEWSNVVALIADNCELNKALSDQTNEPLIGCVSSVCTCCQQIHSWRNGNFY